MFHGISLMNLENLFTAQVEFFKINFIYFLSKKFINFFIHIQEVKKHVSNAITPQKKWITSSNITPWVTANQMNYYWTMTWLRKRGKNMLKNPKDYPLDPIVPFVMKWDGTGIMFLGKQFCRTCHVLLQPGAFNSLFYKEISALTYRKVVSSNTSRLEPHAGLLRLLMKGIFDPYVL